MQIDVAQQANSFEDGEECKLKAPMCEKKKNIGSHWPGVGVHFFTLPSFINVMQSLPYYPSIKKQLLHTYSV